MLTPLSGPPVVGSSDSFIQVQAGVAPAAALGAVLTAVTQGDSYVPEDSFTIAFESCVSMHSVVGYDSKVGKTDLWGWGGEGRRRGGEGRERGEGEEEGSGGKRDGRREGGGEGEGRRRRGGKKR